MPFKGNWKQPFAASLKAVQGSLSETLKLSVLQILQHVRRDSIIYGATELYDRRRDPGKWAYYKETDEMNRYLRNTRFSGKNGIPRKVFHQTKFVNRYGNLVKAFLPAGGWSGDTLRTRGDSEARVFTIGDKNGERTFAILKFTGKAEGALKGGDSKLSKSIVEVTDRDGRPIATQTERGRRRPLENAVAKVSRFFMKVLKTELDKKTRSIS